MRTRVRAVAWVMGALWLLTGCAAVPGDGARGPALSVRSELATAASGGVASCEPARVRPFSCNEFVVQYPSGDASSFGAWFDVVDGRPRLVVGESEHLRALPIRLQSDGATAAPVQGWKPLQRGCAEGSECALDRLVERVFTGGARVEVGGTRLRVDAGSVVLQAKDTGKVHQYAKVGRFAAGGRALLTYKDNGMHMAAANGGRLSVNTAGCLTDGSFVLVLPDTTVLNKDGSIDIAGRHVPLGGELRLGGGEGPVPADQTCGADGYWYGYGA